MWHENVKKLLLSLRICRTLLLLDFTCNGTSYTCHNVKLMKLHFPSVLLHCNFPSVGCKMKLSSDGFFYSRERKKYINNEQRWMMIDAFNDLHQFVRQNDCTLWKEIWNDAFFVSLKIFYTFHLQKRTAIFTEQLLNNAIQNIFFCGFYLLEIE